MKKRFSILMLVVMLNIFSAQAQDTLSIENHFFSSVRANQDNSYIIFGQGFGNLEPLIFEGLVAPYFLIRTAKDAKWAATLSPAILIRMKAEYSFPVESPSYLPNISFYRELSSGQKSKYMFLKLQHHSNGQSGDFYNADGSLNYETGDFSTNFIEFGIFFNSPFAPVNGTSEYFKSSVEYHFDYHRSKELEGQYSFWRWHNNIRVFKFSLPDFKNMFNKQYKANAKIPKIETSIKTDWLFGYIGDAGFFDIQKRLNLTFVISYRPKVLSDVSLFLKIYSGEDYYNMRFTQRINVLQFGLQAYTFKIQN